jgi:polysaccharide export outer membrane protein
MKAVRYMVSLAVLAGMFLVAGCASDSAGGGRGTGRQAGKPAPLQPELIRAGEILTVTFSDLPPNGAIPNFRDRVKDDGTILLPLGVKAEAAGKTAGQLQQTIEALYVPRYFKRLTVSVQNEERFYFVGGEVRQPNRQSYAGPGLTVLQAIDSAGGFTEFANRRKVTLRRVNGEQYTVNCVKALEDSNLDLPVYPGDKVNVPKRW